MATVWVPLKKPPDFRSVSGLSSDAQLVLAALKKFHQTKEIGSSKAKWQIGMEVYISSDYIGGDIQGASTAL